MSDCKGAPAPPKYVPSTTPEKRALMKNLKKFFVDKMSVKDEYKTGASLFEDLDCMEFETTLTEEILQEF